MGQAVAPDDPERPQGELEDEGARSVLLGITPAMRFGRRFFRMLPSAPRCKLCASPFHGPVGPVMRLVGKAPWPKNPKYCSFCFRDLVKRRAGAEIECSLLFADVRGSTPLAETMRPTEFRMLMNRFYETASHVLFEHDAIVDHFVGDEVIGIFIPALTGEIHAQRAIAAGRALLSATGHDTSEPWLPVGVGVNTGIAFVGVVGEGEQVELTALGDPVNVTARLASAAGTGEILVTLAAAHSAKLTDGTLKHRRLALKGKSESTDVVVISPST